MRFTTTHVRRSAATLSIAMLVAACTDASPVAEIGLLAPVDAGAQAEWIEADPVAVGLDPTALEAARAYAFRREFHTQALLVLRHGYLAAEWYAEGTGAETLAASWSVGKSVTATLIGMAIADGDIAGVDVPMSTFIPAWAGTDKAPITLADVLTMSSGLDWIEDYDGVETADGASDIALMVLDPNPMGIALDQPVTAAAGARWNYSSGDTMLLGYALRQATGKIVADLAQEKLAEPLAMRELHWWRDTTGETFTYCCVDATPRDFAKFGQLYLQDGVWGGKQIVPADWVAASTTAQAADNPGYGYQWWTNHPAATEGNWPSLPTDTYFALGVDGQYIAVFPSLDMVVVRLGHYVVPDTDDWIAEDGLYAAGVFSDNFGPTGTRAPRRDWDEDAFFAFFVEAVVK